MLPFLAKYYMSLRECFIVDRRREAQEEVVADLHTCLEQLTYRCSEMELKIENSLQHAVRHMHLSKKETTAAGKARERARAQMFMADRRRTQKEHDKALRSIQMLQQQIDSIVSTHVDMVIVDAMRNYNATAARLALPQRTMEVDMLNDCLAERQHEIQAMQAAMSGVGALPQEEEDGDLLRELDAFMNVETTSLPKETAIMVEEEKEATTEYAEVGEPMMINNKVVTTVVESPKAEPIATEISLPA